MKWEGREESDNVEDRRGMKMTGAAVGGGGLLVVIVFVVAQLLGVNPEDAKKIANLAEKVVPQQQQEEEQEGTIVQSPQEERAAHFSKVVLKDTEVIWTDLFRKAGKKYILPKMKLYREGTRSGCGFADSAVGPFYCPADQTIYLDLSFYTEMQEKLGAPGEFARAYVIAHEVGHHVQRLLEYSIDDVRKRGNPVDINHASVRLELQADYLAGVWAHHNEQKYKFLEPGDVESAMNAAKQIGDDHLQKAAGRQVRPDAFTHGSSEQRMRWFMQGLKTGDVNGASALFDLPYNKL